MKKLNITKEQFNRSHYFKNKYGRLEYVSESGKVFKTSKGKILKFKESTDGGKARIERLCTNLEKQYDTFTYDEIERKLKEAGFVLDEYGGKTNAYAVFVHDCGIVVNVEYKFEKDYGTRDSWHAADVTDFGWYDDPEYQRWSTESTKKFGKKFNESNGLEWLNSFKQAQDFVDKACEQLEVAAFEGGADVGNPIHKKLLRIWSEMRDVIESV